MHAARGLHHRTGHTFEMASHLFKTKEGFFRTNVKGLVWLVVISRCMRALF